MYKMEYGQTRKSNPPKKKQKSPREGQGLVWWTVSFQHATFIFNFFLFFFCKQSKARQNQARVVLRTEEAKKQSKSICTTTWGPSSAAAAALPPPPCAVDGAAPASADRDACGCFPFRRASAAAVAAEDSFALSRSFDMTANLD